MNLESLDEYVLQDKIKNFRKLNIKEMSNEDLNNEILNVLCDRDRGFSYFVNLATYPKNTEFFRVRTFNKDIKLNQIMQTSQDFWNPPKSLVRNFGRLNKIGESLLYTTPGDPLICINELKIEPDQVFVLIKYSAINDIKVNIIGGEYNYEKLNIKSKKAIFIHEMINNFLREEYSREVGIGTEHLYKTSEIIAKSFFDLPPEEIQDAWAYISTIDKKSYNVCFRPEIAKKKLQLDGAIVASVDVMNNIKCFCVTSGYDEEDKKTYFHEIGSDYQKKIFPNIK
ncbi:hypothetical protein [Staphylococcus capitis]|uniref:hypothetical protein n=1 Tax=Staphylococcus capitis TaxID=29388 RepID=UPI00384E6DA1